MKFDPHTDHYVQGYYQELPEPGSLLKVRVKGKDVHELVVEAWWTDEPIWDPAIGHRRAAALITRTV